MRSAVSEAPAREGRHAQRRRSRRRIASLAVVMLCSLPAAAPASALASGTPTPQHSAHHAPPPTRAQVVEVQRLFEVLGYPLGSKTLGGLGPRTRGALRYFQHKYGLPVTGLPDTRTVFLMRSVAASLRSAPASTSPSATPHDSVEGLIGRHLPILLIAVGLAALLALLALSGRERTA
jgi:peptidoglycan hydrolase-like protein with peptidoglycan-binding domain